MLDKLLGNVKLTYKLSLAFFMILIPLVITTYYLTATALKDIGIAQHGIEGVRAIAPLQDIAQKVAQHRGASAGFLSGNQALGTRLKPLEHDINQHFNELNKALEGAESLPINSEINSLKKSWDDLADVNLTLSADDSVNMHNQVLANIIGAIMLVSDKSGLSLDAYLDSYYMVVAVTNALPNLANYLGIARAQGAKVLASQTMDEKTKLAMFEKVSNISGLLSELETGSVRIFEENPDAKRVLSSKYEDTLSSVRSTVELINREVVRSTSFSYGTVNYFEETTQTIDKVYDLNNAVMTTLTGILEERATSKQNRMYTEISLILVVVVVACFIAFVIIKGAIKAMDFAIATFDRIAKGNLDNDLSTDNKDEFGQLLHAIGDMQQTLKDKQEEVGRLTSAVEGSTTSFMMADTDGKIVYANNAVKSMLRKREDKLRSVFSSFSVNNIVGTNFDSFHKNPAHQQNLLGNPDNLPYKTEITVAGLTFELIAIALRDEQQNHLGTAVQWVDLTEEKDAQRQVEKLISDAISGKLDSRIDTSEYEGFMKNLGDNINGLMNAVVEPINEAITIAQSLAQGDLTQTMDGQYGGEFLALAKAMNGSIDKLSNMVDEIRSASTNVFDSSREIAEGNNELSHRTESQASSLEETASAMEELTSTVQQNSENATQANKLANDVMEKATNGGLVVQNAITAMSDINKSSNKIADIISVIDEIAFQTNLLALNAAVEAARAGEQGRGFAVVAAEVRNLAQRSAGAAKEIKGLINDSVDAVGQGTKLVDETGQTFTELVSSIEEVGKMLEDIDSAGREQSAGIGEVSAAVSQMDEMTQQNAALVEQAAASSKSMEEQSQLLLEQVSFFNNGESKNVTGTFSQAKNVIKPATLQVKRKANSRPVVEADQEWEEF
ncbi:methyl-accepting chemotaxis protein [Thalassotalea fusca]